MKKASILLILIFIIVSCNKKIKVENVFDNGFENVQLEQQIDSMLIADYFKDDSNVTVTIETVEDGHIITFYRDSVKVSDFKMLKSDGHNAEGIVKIKYAKD